MSGPIATYGDEVDGVEIGNRGTMHSDFGNPDTRLTRTSLNRKTDTDLRGSSDQWQGTKDLV